MGDQNTCSIRNCRFGIRIRSRSQATCILRFERHFRTGGRYGSLCTKPRCEHIWSTKKKKIVTGKITEGKSYVPAGLTASQYNKVRAAEVKKKAGIFEDYTDFYLKRGTDNSESWAKSVTNGHRMAKTKYDWSGSDDNAAQVGLAASGKKNAPKKKKKNIFGL